MTPSDKLAHDIAALEAALKEDPSNTRHAFHLAESYRDSGALEKALAAYDHRATMAGFDQEVFISLLNGARLAARLSHSMPEVIDRYLRAYEFRPSRAEALGELARYLREQGPRWQLGYLVARRAMEIPLSFDALSVEPYWYECGCLDEFAVAAFWIGEYEESKRACERLLGIGTLPLHDRERILANLNFARAKLGLAAIT